VTGLGCTEHQTPSRMKQCPRQNRPHGDGHRCAVTIPSEHAGILPLDSNTKALEGLTALLCIDGDVRVLESQHQWSCLKEFCTQNNHHNVPIFSNLPVLLHNSRLTSGVSIQPHNRP
jgi:hypothetical protein